MGIYKFHADLNRMGELSGVFTASNDDVAKIIGEDVYFGEILGKHSDIHFDMEDHMFTLVTEDENFIKLFNQYDLQTGTNPFAYVDINELEDEEDLDENKIEADDL